jgi:hypothetical protein
MSRHSFDTFDAFDSSDLDISSSDVSLLKIQQLKASQVWCASCLSQQWEAQC